MKKLLLAGAVLIGLAIPAAADFYPNWIKDDGFTTAYDGFVRVRNVPNGADVIDPLPNGVHVDCYERYFDDAGFPWTHIIVGNIAGWSRSTSLSCHQ